MHQLGVLADVHQSLLVKAQQKFYRLDWADQVKLFCNLGDRLFSTQCCLAESRLAIPADMGISKGAICLEISEQHEICNADHLIGQLQQFRKNGCRIAVDDYGTGFAGTHILYFAKPEYVKIDRFYIQNIESDAHKRMLAASMVNIAHLTGSLVIAEGVETEKEFYCCKTIGCDLIQGYLIQKPQLDIEQLSRTYDFVRQLHEQDRRKTNTEDKSLIQAELEYIEPIGHDEQPVAILDAFKKSRKNTFFPVVNQHHEALGIVLEETVKEYAYSEFGRYLLANPTTNKTIDDFISRIPIVDIHTPVARILETFAANEHLEGIIITNSLKYVGILRAHSLLRIVNEKKLAAAIDQNPLSGLPGNKLIYEHVSKALQDETETYVIVYFDFDNFKAYNNK
jgi:EAL domain-containing protein (putative c-di-GMP-specific phosphodiesterase class I)